MAKQKWSPSVLLGLVALLVGTCIAGCFAGTGVLDDLSDIEVSGRPADADATHRQDSGTFRLFGGLPPTLDPALVQDSTSAEYIVHIFSGLVSLNSELEVVPDLASRWEIAEGGRVYTFHLLPDATFQDGRPITAEDLIYSMERACSPELCSPVALAYLGDIVGAAAFSRGEADRIQGLEATGEHELRVEIDAPKAYFLSKLTYPTAFVVDREQIEAEGSTWQQNPNGSGPFVLEEFDRDRIVLSRNDCYYGDKPALERVEYILSGGLPMTMYENDELDMVPVGPGEIERVLDPNSSLHEEHLVAPELSVQYIGLNVGLPPFDDLRVRQAFAQAIDRDKIAELVLKGTALPAKGILPPALPDYDQNLEGLDYNPRGARELLAASRYGAEGTMPVVVLAVSGTSGHMSSTIRAVWTMVKENLGIEMVVEQVEWKDFLRDLNEKRYQMFSAGWIADYPDSQNFLDILFHSQSAQNHTWYANEQVDELLERARVESNPEKRATLYRTVERLIIDDVPWIPLTHGTTHVLRKPYIGGFEAGATLYPWLKDVYFQ